MFFVFYSPCRLYFVASNLQICKCSPATGFRADAGWHIPATMNLIMANKIFGGQNYDNRKKKSELVTVSIQ